MGGIKSKIVFCQTSSASQLLQFCPSKVGDVVLVFRRFGLQQRADTDANHAVFRAPFTSRGISVLHL